MKLDKLFAAVLVAAFAVPVLAQNANTPHIDKRQANQQKRIDQGVKSGALTEKEATHLQKREDRLAAHEAKAKADGVVTPAERRRLQREQERTSRAIRKQKHDKQTAQ